MGGSPTSSKNIPSGGFPTVDPLPIDDGWVEAGIHPLNAAMNEVGGFPDVNEAYILEALADEVGNYG